MYALFSSFGLDFQRGNAMWKKSHPLDAPFFLHKIIVVQYIENRNIAQIAAQKQMKTARECAFLTSEEEEGVGKMYSYTYECHK